MSVINKVIVTSQLRTGDSIDVSVKALDRPFTDEDRQLLDTRIKQSIVPKIDDTLYFKVRKRSGINGKVKDNWNKIKSLADLSQLLDSVLEVN